MTELLSIEQAAYKLSMSQETLRALVTLGEIPAFKATRRSALRIHIDDLEAFRKRRTTTDPDKIRALRGAASYATNTYFVRCMRSHERDDPLLASAMRLLQEALDALTEI